MRRRNAPRPESSSLVRQGVALGASSLMIFSANVIRNAVEPEDPAIVVGRGVLIGQGIIVPVENGVGIDCDPPFDSYESPSWDGRQNFRFIELFGDGGTYLFGEISSALDFGGTHVLSNGWAFNRISESDSFEVYDFVVQPTDHMVSDNARLGEAVGRPLQQFGITELEEGIEFELDNMTFNISLLPDGVQQPGLIHSEPEIYAEVTCKNE